MNIKEQIQKRGFTVSQVAALMTNKKGEKGITQSSLSQTFYSIQIPAPLSLPPDLSENNHPPRWKKDKRMQGFPFPSHDRFQKVLYRSDNTPDHHFLPEYGYL